MMIMLMMYETLGRNFGLCITDISTQRRTFIQELHLYQTSKCTDVESAYLAILYLGQPIIHFKCDKRKLKVKSARQPINQAYIFLSPLACKKPTQFKTRLQETNQQEDIKRLQENIFLPFFSSAFLKCFSLSVKASQSSTWKMQTLVISAGMWSYFKGF